MKTIYDSSKTSAELAGVEKEIKKALLKIYKEYTKIAGKENEIYLSMSISTTENKDLFLENNNLIISANNAYFKKGSFDSKNPLRLWVAYEK